MSELNRRAEGLQAYADQLGMSVSDVEAHFITNYGSAFSESAFLAAGGGNWQENELSLRERSLIVITVLTTLGAVDERLRGHLKWASQHNLNREDLEAALALIANYAGFARASVAMDLLNELDK
jgi:alkylhydroperoxidase/carboxymuconolactone decarboxylase family protein YurZ